MGIHDFASRNSYKVFTATGSGGALTVASGEPVQVCGMVFRSRDGGPQIWTVTDASDTALFTVAVLGNDTSFEVQTCWIADAGLKVQSDTASGSVVVFHNSPGN